MIRHIQKDTGSAVASIEQGISQIGQGVGLANKTGEALAPVHSMIYSTTGVIEQIAMSRKSNQRQQDKWRVTWNPWPNRFVPQPGDVQSAKACHDIRLLAGDLQKSVGSFRV